MRFDKATQNSFPNFAGQVDGRLSWSGTPGGGGGHPEASADVSVNVPLLIVVGVLLFLFW